MTDLKIAKVRLTKLKAEHFELDKLILHLTAQALEASKKASPNEKNKLKEFKTKKQAVSDEIARLENEIQNS